MKEKGHPMRETALRHVTALSRERDIWQSRPWWVREITSYQGPGHTWITKYPGVSLTLYPGVPSTIYPGVALTLYPGVREPLARGCTAERYSTVASERYLAIKALVGERDI